MTKYSKLQPVFTIDQLLYIQDMLGEEMDRYERELNKASNPEDIYVFESNRELATGVWNTIDQYIELLEGVKDESV